jgi:hypothetical protein
MIIKMPTFYAEHEKDEIKIFSTAVSDPVVTQHIRPDHRPFLHPISPPDGVGELTEYSPGHHPHQTGLYWGFTRINGSDIDKKIVDEWFYRSDKPSKIEEQIGRDFFHNPGSDYWRLNEANVLVSTGDIVRWQSTYDLLDDSKETLLSETQDWSIKEFGAALILDLEWQGLARKQIRVNTFSYGGLFLRMPYRAEKGGIALNSSGQYGAEAEGRPARWVGVEMPICGREEMLSPSCSVIIMDHPSNSIYPTPWRVDGQLGIGPCRAIHESWDIKESSTELFRHRIMITSGELCPDQIEESWDDFAVA